MASEGDLFKLKVIEEKEDMVKVHYIGYSKRHDEWRKKEDIVVLDDDSDDDDGGKDDGEEAVTGYIPFSLYRVLANKIKLSLNSSRKASPSVRIDMEFDRVVYEGGLAKNGTRKRRHGKRDIFGVKEYKDLDGLLGKGWHWRGLNQAGDFCYVVKDSVEFYLTTKRALKEFKPVSSSSDVVTVQERDLGCSLVFKFVRGDGTAQQFGVDKTIF